MNNSGIFSSRRRYRSCLQPRHGWPEITALVDIFFLCMLFFVLSSNSATISGIRVELPRATTLNISRVDRFVVSVLPASDGSGNCSIFFQDSPVTMNQLAEKLSRLSSDSHQASVIIRADRQISFDLLAQIMSLAESSGLASFLAMSPPAEKTDTRFEQ